MLRPFDQALALGLLADTAKTTSIGFILLQFDPRYPPGQQLPEGAEMLAGPMNFALQGAWSVGAKGSWVNLSPIEAEIVGYWHASRRLLYHIRGAPVIYGFVDHQPFAEMYERKSMSDLSPRMLKLMKELMEYPFKMKYIPGKGSMIRIVDALSRAQHDDVSKLWEDPLDLQYHPMHRDQAQVSHEVCFATQALGNQEPCPCNPALGFMYDAAADD